KCQGPSLGSVESSGVPDDKIRVLIVDDDPEVARRSSSCLALFLGLMGAKWEQPLPRQVRRVALPVPSTYLSNQLQPPAASIHDAAHRRVALRRSFHVVAASHSAARARP